MIDPNSQFFAILTAAGEAKQANADALGIPWKLTEMGVGDANGTDPIPDRVQTRLINERRRRPLNKLSVDPANPNILVAEQIIPADEGGWWIREIGLYDADGALVAVANCAPSYKPLMSQGSGRTQVVRMNFIVSSAANVVLKIDPAVVLATRQHVDESIADAVNRQDAKQSVLVATTGPIQLAGTQTIDGVPVPFGSRVLVKDQAQAKENGIYLTGDIWRRATDSDSSAKVTPGLLVAVEQGTASADTLWLLSTDGPIVLGTTPLTFKGVTQGLAPISSPALIGTPTAPTAAQFDSSKVLATTEFVRRALGNYRGFTDVASSTTLTAAAVGTLVNTVGMFTVTLPPANIAPAGSVIHFHNPSTGVVTIVCAGSDLICFSGGHRKSITLVPDAELELVSNGDAGWWPSGSAKLQYSNAFFSTPAQFDNSKAVATTEFVQRTIGGFGRVFSYGVAGQTILPGQVNSHINVFGTCSNLTLPLLSSVPVGSSVYIGAASLLCTIMRQGSDTIFLNSTLGSAPTITVNDGESVLLVSNGTQWIASGVAMLKYAAGFGASFATAGYSKLPNGLVEQWGAGTTSVSGDIEITFPLAWTIMPLGIHVTPVLGQDVARPTVMMTTYRPATGLTKFAVGGFLNGARLGESFFWRAIGKV